MSGQEKLTQWLSGFFDGEGTVEAGVGVKESYNTGYSFHPQCRIRHTQMAGFFDAEGCVSAPISADQTCRLGYSLGVDCNIGHTQTETPVKEALKTFCDEIGVTPSISDYEENGNRQDHFSIRIGSQGGVRKFLTELRPYLIVKKPEADIMLEEILPRLENKVHSSRRGFLEIMQWVDRLNAHKGGKRGNYTLEYFENEWGMTLDA